MTDYTIKAIPTRYNGVQFRSRLEATWAAYFDLCDIHWQYEPFDLDGWAPDFVLRHGENDVLVEVKPCRSPSYDPVTLVEYEKASRYAATRWVLLLGREPELLSAGHLYDHPNKMWLDADPWVDLHNRLSPLETLSLWKQATNITRWKGPRS